jgi:hypothetical protein
MELRDNYYGGSMSEATEPAIAVPAPLATEAQQPQPTTPEVVPPSPPQEMDVDTTKKLALLTKRERQILEAKQSWENEKKSWESSKSELEKKAAIADAIANKDWNTLKAQGFDYNDYTKYLLNDEKPTMESLLEKQARTLEEKFESKIKMMEEEKFKQQQEMASQHNETLINNFKSQIKTELADDFKEAESKFQFLSAQDEPETLVYEVINAYYEQSKKKDGLGKVLKTFEAADLVEKQLEEEYFKRYSKVNKLKTLHGKMFPVEQTETKPSFFRQESPLKTISSQQPAPTSTQDSVKPWSREESIAAAAKLLKFDS